MSFHAFLHFPLARVERFLIGIPRRRASQADDAVAGGVGQEEAVAQPGDQLVLVLHKLQGHASTNDNGSSASKTGPEKETRSQH